MEEGASSAARRAIHEHAEAGEAARLFAVLFLLAVIAYVIVPWFLARRAGAAVADGTGDEAVAVRPTWLRPVLMVAVAATAVGSLVTIVNAGHSGAESVWGDLPAGEVDGHDDGDD